MPNLDWKATFVPIAQFSNRSATMLAGFDTKLPNEPNFPTQPPSSQPLAHHQTNPFRPQNEPPLNPPPSPARNAAGKLHPAGRKRIYQTNPISPLNPHPLNHLPTIERTRFVLKTNRPFARDPLQPATPPTTPPRPAQTEITKRTQSPHSTLIPSTTCPPSNEPIRHPGNKPKLRRPPHRFHQRTE
jgi:hypothetical protein